MRNVFLPPRWTTAALAIALLAVTSAARADNEPKSKNKGSGDSGARSNNSSGRRSSNDGGKPGAAGGAGTITNKGRQSAAPGGAGTITNKGRKLGAPGGTGTVTNKGGFGVLVPGGGTPGTGVAGGGKLDTKKVPDKSAWSKSTKEGWHKDGWNNNFNSQHKNHRHGYWNNGIWIAPWIIVGNQPWVYLQPAQPIVSGQKWLGVTYEPYDGGGAYVNGIYEGSPAQRIGIEVGDVIVTLDGVDATQLGSVIQASDGNVVLQVLSGRTGQLVELPVNLIR